jgi:cell wall-associated NlpC family hydrolase
MEISDSKYLERSWDKYIGLEYKHLGLYPETGIDCFNLIKYIYKKELNIEIPYTTRTFCNIVDETWYYRNHERYFDDNANSSHGWEKTDTLEPFTAIAMVLGASTTTNHCALYIGNNKIIHTMIKHKSHIATYGSYYKQYTVGKYKWVGIKN